MQKFTIRSRTLVRRGNKKGDGESVLHAEGIESVLDLLGKIDLKQATRDVRITPSHLEATFEGGVMRAHISPHLSHHKILSGPMRVFTHAASQWHAQVLPPRFWAGFKQLAKLNPTLATRVWDEFSRTCKKPVVVRTTMMRDAGGTPVRAVRAVVSTKYAKYSHLQLVQDIIDKAGHFQKMPVLDWWLTDTGIRIRFLGIDPVTSAFARFDPKTVLLGKPLPVVDIWNSETGHATVGVSAGLLNMKTLCGLGHWDGSATHTWRHVGSHSRIQGGLRHAFHSATTAAQELAKLYDEAGKVVVTDPEKWLRAQMTKNFMAREGIPSRVLDITVKLLSDPSVTPGGKLASVVDALTLASAAESDMYTAGAVEKAASRIMHRGWELAQKTNGVL